MLNHETPNETTQSFQKPTALAYCDYIAHSIARLLPLGAEDLAVGRVKSDLHPTLGYLMTTQKTIEVEHYGKMYLITIAEVK